MAANVYITEFSDMQPMTVAGGLGAVVLWPAVAKQNMTTNAGSQNSAPFNGRTRMIRVNVDAACSIDIGSTPTATASTTRMSPNSTEYFGVSPGHIIAVINNT